jgi:[acyl-carrier-protein] S-malonyltransferase
LVKRALPGVETFALKTPDQLDKARQFVEDHAHEASPMNDSPTWRLVVSPMKGTFTASGLTEGEQLSPGTVVGTVASLRESQTVVAPHGGTVLEWLVTDGDPVAPGQPLVRLHPEAVRA